MRGLITGLMQVDVGVFLSATLGAGLLLLLLLRWQLRLLLRGAGGFVWCFGLCAGIRVLLACFTRCPCAGRHLLFFAAAKKSRQKKAAHTANPCVCLRAPTGSYASHGSHVTHVRCPRSCGAPHPPHAPELQHAVPGSPPPPRWQTLCRPRYSPRLTSDR